jgi:hypothetical protein
MMNGKKQRSEGAVRVTDDFHLAQIKRFDQLREIFGIGHSRVTRNRCILVRKIVSSAVSDSMVVFREYTHLILPVGLIAERSVNEYDRLAAALLGIM